jgi:hypothetical protein
MMLAEHRHYCKFHSISTIETVRSTAIRPRVASDLLLIFRESTCDFVNVNVSQSAHAYPITQQAHRIAEFSCTLTA